LILRKYLAWLSSTATLLILGWMMIPKGFSGIADWLAPVFGPAFRPELYLAFLMFGPSLTYTPLLLVWVAAGVVGGFFSRGVWRSVAAASMETVTVILVMIGSGLMIVTSLGGFGSITGGFSGLSIPPPPPGLGLGDIVNAPMIGQIISAVTSGGSINPVSIVEILLVNFAVNRVIHTVSFAASGVLFSKLFQKLPHRQPVLTTPVYAPIPAPAPAAASLPTPLPGQQLVPSPAQPPLAEKQNSMPQKSASTSIPPAPLAQGDAEPTKREPASTPTLEIRKKDEKTQKQEDSGESSSGQSAAKVAVVILILALSFSTLLTPAGPAHILQSSTSNGQPLGEQLMLNLQKDGTLKMSYSTNLTSLPSGIPSDYRLEEFQGLAGAFIFAFNGSIDLGQNGSGGSGGQLSTIASLLPPNGFLAVYGGVDPSTGKARADKLASDFQQAFGVTETSVVNMMLPSFGGSGGNMYLAIYQGDGTVGSVGNKILNLVQTTGVGSVLSSPRVFVSSFGAEAGFLNINFQNSTATPSLTPGVQISADLTQWGNFYGRGTFTLGVREILGSQGVIGPSSTAGTTSVQLGFPANSTVITYWPSNATLDTTLDQLSYSMNATSTPVSDVYVTFTNVFPRKIEVSRTLDPASPVSSGTVLTEHVTVTNEGNESIQGAVASEIRLFQAYPTLKLLSASENVSLGDIAPQSTAQASVLFKVTSDGVYTMPGTVISYIDQGQVISKTAGTIYLRATFSARGYAEALIQATAPYSYLFLFLAVLPLIIQIPRSLGKRKAQAGSRPVQAKAQKGQSQDW
jgi:hypothetical protein